MRIGIRLLFSRHFYNKFSVPLYISVGSRYMLEGQKLKRNENPNGHVTSSYQALLRKREEPPGNVVDAFDDI